MNLPVNLIAYLPDFLRDIYEYKVLMTAAGGELGLLEQARRQNLANTFVDSLDEEGVLRWENMLHIEAETGDSTADRMFRIKMYLAGDRPYTYNALKKQLQQLCGGVQGVNVTLDASKYTLRILISLTAKSQAAAAEKLIRKMLPCNMILDFGLKYNQYETLAPYTYAQLKVYSYKDLRESVLGG